MFVCVGQVCVSGGWGAITPVMGKRWIANLKYRTLKRDKIEKQEESRKQRDRRKKEGDTDRTIIPTKAYVS